MNYKISGKVVRGDGYGKKIGFPTVNLKTGEVDVSMAGVYSGDAMLDGKKYRAGIVIGPGIKTEAHLIGYNGDAYGKEVIFEIKKFIREFKKFETEKELIKQIKKDLKLC